MRKVNKLLLTLMLLFSTLLPAVPALAQSVLDPSCTDPEIAKESTLCQENQNTQGKNTIYGSQGIFTKAISILSFVIGFVSVLVIMIGGFKYVTSNGDSNSVNSAKNTILYAVIGLVIAATAQAIIVFVVNKL